ncbi:MAG: histidine kinase [Propionibacteriaceae bacterium]
MPARGSQGSTSEAGLLSRLLTAPHTRRRAIAIAGTLTGLNLLYYLFALLAIGPALPPSSGSVNVLLLATGGVVIQIGQGAALLIRDKRPIVSFLLVLLGFVCLAVLHQDRTLAAGPIYWFSIFSLALHASGPASLITAVIGVGTDYGVLHTLILTGGLADRPGAGAASPERTLAVLLSSATNVFISYALCLGAGLAVASYRRRIDNASERISTLQREREAQVDAAVAAERRRMARELHDVAAHHLTGLIVQTKAAAKLQATAPERVPELLEEIKDQGQKSLHSLRQVVQVLRLEGGRDYAPQPAVVDLPELVDQSRRLIPELDLALTGDFADVDEAVNLSCYRIVQESLANAFRHSPGSAVSILVERHNRLITVEVVNGPGPRATASDGQGYGLDGMRERAELLGGSLVAGATDDGGWKVRAQLDTKGRISR